LQLTVESNEQNTKNILLHYYYNRFTAPWTVSGTTRVSRYQEGKTNLALLEQEIVKNI